MSIIAQNAISLLRYRFGNVFSDRSMYMQMRTGSFREDFSNDEKRSNVFILDDTLFNRTSCKKTELASKVFDHTNMRYK